MKCLMEAEYQGIFLTFSNPARVLHSLLPFPVCTLKKLENYGIYLFLIVLLIFFPHHVFPYWKLLISPKRCFLLFLPYSLTFRLIFTYPYSFAFPVRRRGTKL